MKRERPNPMGDTPIENSLFMFKVMLDNYVDSLAFRIDSRLRTQFIHDLNNDPNWFDKWSQKLGMGTNLTVYGVSAMVLLKEYSKEQLTKRFKHEIGGTDNPQLADGQ